jgi:UDP-glucose 4-epimerase
LKFKKILITGGAGFIGSHLVEHFQGIASEIIVLDNLRSGYIENLSGLDHTFVHGCITHRALVDSIMPGTDYVFHLAAMISVPESMAKPIECNHINVTGLLNVLESAAQHRVRKFIHASSAAVYGDNPNVPKTEYMIPEPRSPYAITKLDGEYYLEMFRREGRINTASLRFFNVFGPRQDPNSAYAAAVPIFAQKALSGEPITIFGDGDQTRDFISVKDVTSALAHAASNENMQGTYNVGYGNSITINQLAQEIIHLTGSKSQITHSPDRPGDVKHSRANIDRLTNSGWKPSQSLKEALALTLRSTDIPVRNF